MTKKPLFLVLLLLLFVNTLAISCGDGIREGIEECDDGVDNSDTVADKCRTSCELPSCGDGVVDTGEECDDSGQNSDIIPNACRTDCREAYCGDGVLDYASNSELCDDGNTNAYDGCHQCIPCYKPKDNLHLSNSYEYVQLCWGQYTLADNGEEGVIIIDGSDMIVDCNNVEIISSTTSTMQSNTAGISADSSMANIGANSQSNQGGQNQQQDGFFSQIVGAITMMMSGGQQNSEQNSQQSGSPNIQGESFTERYGTGIYVKGSNIVLINCRVQNFRNGIKIDSLGSVLVNNRLCTNTYGIRQMNSGNFGIKNTCNTAINWQENGVSGCTYKCDGQMNLPEEVECPECVCEVCEEGSGSGGMILCPNGMYVNDISLCPPQEQQTCQQGQLMCPDGTCVNNYNNCVVSEKPQEEPAQTCPAGYIMCQDGTCALSIQNCPVTNSCPNGYYKCQDGTCVRDMNTCAESSSGCLPGEVLCPNNECVRDIDDCPILCPDGTYKQECTFRCSDGTIVGDLSQCPVTCPTGYVMCSGGTCVRDKTECPEYTYNVCCKIEGDYYEVSNKDCDAKNGSEVSDEFCGETYNVCCKSSTGYIEVTNIKCLEMRGSIVEKTNCETNVCCMISSRESKLVQYSEMTESECKEKGTVVNDMYCQSLTTK